MPLKAGIPERCGAIRARTVIQDVLIAAGNCNLHRRMRRSIAIAVVFCGYALFLGWHPLCSALQTQ